MQRKKEEEGAFEGAAKEAKFPWIHPFQGEGREGRRQ